MNLPRLGFTASLLLACDGEPVESELVRAGELTQPPSGLIGETVAIALPCEWPTAVVLGAGGCSGVLIHPQVVMTAGHCIGGGGPSEVRFGEQAGMPARTVATTGCAANPAAMGVSVDDYAYCTLAEPVDLPIAPPLMGCELDTLEVGQPFVTIGWGNGDGGGGIKRFAATEFVGFNAGMIAASSTPSEVCSGDSGGPTFMQMPDGSWRTVGVSSGGPVGQIPGCINPVFVVPAAVAAGWIEAQTGIDITPCTLGDGTWAAGPDCTEFSLTPDVGGEWVDQSCAGELSEPSSSCGPSVAQPEETDPPTVTITMPGDGAQYPGPSATIDIGVVTDDGDGVAVVAVDLFVDGQPVASDSVDWPLQAPSSWTFAGATFNEGQFTLTANATDWWGNVGESEPVTFLVGEAPSGDGDGEPGDGDPGDGDGDSDTGNGDTADGDPDEGGTGESGITDDTLGADEAGASEGCSCNSSAPRSVYLAWALLAFLPLARRRR
jgi:uncharacterized protein (TIGR03382 family)